MRGHPRPLPRPRSSPFFTSTENVFPLISRPPCGFYFPAQGVEILPLPNYPPLPTTFGRGRNPPDSAAGVAWGEAPGPPNLGLLGKGALKSPPPFSAQLAEDIFVFSNVLGRTDTSRRWTKRTGCPAPTSGPLTCPPAPRRGLRGSRSRRNQVPTFAPSEPRDEPLFRLLPSLLQPLLICTSSAATIFGRGDGVLFSSNFSGRPPGRGRRFWVRVSSDFAGILKQENLQTWPL